MRNVELAADAYLFDIIGSKADFISCCSWAMRAHAGFARDLGALKPAHPVIADRRSSSAAR